MVERFAVCLAVMLASASAFAEPNPPPNGTGDPNGNGDSNGNANGNGNGNDDKPPPPPPDPLPPPPPPPPPRYLPADHAYGEPTARWVHQLGYIMPVTIGSEHVTFGFYGITYSPRYRKPYDREGVIAPSSVVGNEWGLETRLLSSIRTHSGITTTISLAPISQVRRKDWTIAFPSLVGALMPEVGFVLVSPKETGGRYRTELYLRHIARFQYLIGKGVLALEAAPFVQISFPLDEGPRRLEGGFLFGISCELPPKD